MAKKNNSSLGKSNDDFIEFDYTDKHQADNKYVSKRKAKKILAAEKTKSTEPMSHENMHSPIGVPNRTIKRILNQQTKSSIRPKFNTDNEHDDYDLGDYEKSY